MIPHLGCDPKINILTIGGFVIGKLKNGALDSLTLLEECSKDLSVSVDHIILSLDWLYSINAICEKGSMVSLNEIA